MHTVRDQEFIEQVADRLATVRGVQAVALGGSRATGQDAPSSDYDFAIYYRGHLDPNDLRALGWDGVVSEIGGWGGGIMNGGAWLNIGGRPVDVHYRDLNEIEFHLAEAQAGRFRVERLPFYLAGIPTYVVVAELALGRVLSGTLPRPEYPPLLRETAGRFWHDSAQLTLAYAEKAYAAMGDPIGVAGALARAIMEEGHARLAARGEWVLNEKRLAARAGLTHLRSVLAAVGNDASALSAAIATVRGALQ